MPSPRIVDTLAERAWQRLFPGQTVPARMSRWLRTADVTLAIAALGVVALRLFPEWSGPLRLHLVTDDGQWRWAERLLVTVSCPCGVIAGIGSARLGAAVDSLSARHGLRALDGWFPLRGRWLALVLCLTLALVGGGLVLFGLAQPFLLLYSGPSD